MPKHLAPTCNNEQASARGKKRFLFQPLPYIRQTGIQREWDGTTIDSYVVSVNRDTPPIVLTLKVSATPSVYARAHFDPTMREALREGEAQ